MKIYFCGSHSTGKSTLTRYTSKKYNLPMISETARMVLSEQELQIDTLRYDLDIADSFQNNVFERQLIEEQKYSTFASDRSIIDILAYTAQHSRIFSKLVRDPLLAAYIENLRQPDVFIFFVRPSRATLKADGVRESLTWDGVVAIDAMVKLIIQMYELRHFTIHTDNMQERVKFIDSIIDRH